MTRFRAACRIGAVAIGAGALLAPVGATAAYGSPADAAAPAAAVTKTVLMKDGSASCPTSPSGCFAPKTLTIRKGDSVKWSNPIAGFSPHTATSSTGGFNFSVSNGKISPTKTFTKVGTFGYKCSFHPTMTGTIKVTL